jgi:hypothetical protein
MQGHLSGYTYSICYILKGLGTAGMQLSFVLAKSVFCQLWSMRRCGSNMPYACGTLVLLWLGYHS